MFTSPALKKHQYAPFIGLVAFGVLSVALGVNLSLKDVYSATGSMYIQTPKTAIKDNSVDIAVRINPGGSRVDTVTATIGFDSSKFTYNTVSFAGSPFTTQLPTKVQDNSVTVVSSLLGSTIDRDSLIAVVSFTPKVNEAKFQAGFSLNGNAAYAGVATDPAYADHTFAFTQQSPSSIPTDPLKIIFPDNQTNPPGTAAADQPLATLTPADGAAAYNGAQILLATSDVASRVRQITPKYFILIGSGFVLMCTTIALFAHYKKRHAEFLRLQSHMNLVRF